MGGRESDASTTIAKQVPKNAVAIDADFRPRSTFFFDLKTQTTAWSWMIINTNHLGVGLMRPSLANASTHNRSVA